MTNKSDLEKARIIAGYTKDSAVICEIALALKAERESLPESVKQQLIDSCICNGRDICCSCESYRQLVRWQKGDNDTGKGE